MEAEDIKKGIRHACMSYSSPGPSTSNKPTQPNEMSRKEQKNKEYHIAKNRMRDSSIVERPQLNENYHDYFQHARQVNMRLDDTEHFRNLTAIQSWEAPQQLLKTKTSSLQQLYPESSSLIEVNTKDGLQKLADVLSSCDEFSVDLEGSDEHCFLGMTALIQFGTWSNDYILDPFPLFTEIQNIIKPILENGSILKIFFGGDNDFLWLQRDFDIQVVGAVDCQDAYDVIREDKSTNKIGLKSLAKIVYPKMVVDKSIRLEDWRKRPFSNNMKKYAREDVHLTLRMWNYLRYQINRRQDSEMWQKVFSATKKKMVKPYQLKKYPTAIQELRKSSLQIKPENLELYELLHQYREYCALHMDNTPSSVLNLQQLIQICEVQPTTLTELETVVSASKTKLKNELFLPTLLKIINEKAPYMTRINNTLCHNCLSKGHNAIICPFPPNPDRLKEYMSTHKEQKSAQVKRRNRNKKINAQLRKLEGKQ